MSHNVETMAYSGATPWHGLGNQVDHRVSIEEMSRAAGLDWTVDPQQMFFRDKNGAERIVADRLVWIRSKDGKQMTVSGKSWHGTQNSEFLEFFRQYSFEGGAQICTAGSLQGGKLVWALADLGHEFSVGNKLDKVRGYLLASWSHATGRSNRMKLVQTRVVCNNTLEMAWSEKSTLPEYTQAHFKAFDFSKAKETIALCHAALDTQASRLQAAANVKMNEFDIVAFLQPLLQPGVAADQMTKLMDPINQNDKMKGVLLSIAKAPGATQGTGWSVINGVTHWTDHVAGRSADARLTRAWFGDRGELKRQVTEKVLALA